jgi:predicted amidophosphoribosyltransferase
VKFRKRATARVLQSLIVGNQIIRHVVCTACDKYFDAKDGACPACEARLCPKCLIFLLDDEPFCPRCGPSTPSVKPKEPTCPECDRAVPADTLYCADCSLELCPQCSEVISETDLSCPNCGANFELFCPQCDNPVSASAECCTQCGLVF